MTYDLNQVISVLRATIPNVGPHVVTDRQITTFASQALRRLSTDRPRQTSTLVTGTGKRYYEASDSLPGWQPGVSRVVGVANPAPDLDADTDIEWLPIAAFGVLDLAGTEYLDVKTRINTGADALVAYTAPWLVTDVDGATTTTLEQRYWGALEFMVVHLTALSLAIKSAGSTDQALPSADLLNFRSKEAEYRRMATEYAKLYAGEIQALPDTRKAFITRGDYPKLSPGRGDSYLTHRSY